MITSYFKQIVVKFVVVREKFIFMHQNLARARYALNAINPRVPVALDVNKI
jgi:hypothetical protein